MLNYIMIIRLLIYYRFVNTIRLDNKVCFNHEHRVVTDLFIIVTIIKWGYNPCLNHNIIVLLTLLNWIRYALIMSIGL